MGRSRYTVAERKVRKAQKAQQWEIANRAHRKKYFHEYYLKRKVTKAEELRAYQRAYYARNKLKYRAAHKRYAKRHAVAIKFSRALDISMAEARAMLVVPLQHKPVVRVKGHLDFTVKI